MADDDHKEEFNKTLLGLKFKKGFQSEIFQPRNLLLIFPKKNPVQHMLNGISHFQ
jgi:hypothetical protein